MNTNKLHLTLPTLLLVTALSTPSHASGEDCFRDTDCPTAQSCLDRTCTDDPSIEPCSSDDDCAGAHHCSEGSCKRGGVRCDNPAGTCWVISGAGHCACISGQGSDWSDPNDTDALMDEALHGECVAALVRDCGDDLPELPESCTGDTLRLCEQAADARAHWRKVCDESPQNSFPHLLGCCHAFDSDEGSEDEQKIQRCLAELEPAQACGDLTQQMHACFYLTEDPDNDSGDESDSDVGGDTEDADEDEAGIELTDTSGDDDDDDDDDDAKADDQSDSGCSTSPNGAGSGTFVAALAGFFGLLRRRAPTTTR